MQQRNVFREAITTLIGCFFVLGLTSGTGKTQTTENATTTSGGNWTDPSTWVCTPALSPCVPNNTASYLFDVGMNGGTVVLNGSSSLTAVTVDSLSVASYSLALDDAHTLTVMGDMNNASLYGQDRTGQGGSELFVGGTLTNTNYMQIGSGATSYASTLNIGAFDNLGTLYMYGGSSAEAQVVMNVAGAAPPTFWGIVELYGDAGGAVLDYQAGASIEQLSGHLLLNGPNALLESGGAVGNSALTGLTEIATNGYLNLYNGAVVSTDTSLTNSGSLVVSDSGNINVSAFTAGGSLTNAGMIQVGDSFSGTSGLVTVDGSLDNTGGKIILEGAGTAESLLTVTGAAPTVLLGDVELYGGTGGAELSYGSGGITQIGDGAANAGSITLDGAHAFIEAGGNSGLAGLTTIASNGALELENGARVSVNGALANYGNLYVDEVGSGGSVLQVGGDLTFGGQLYVGNASITTASVANVAGAIDNVGTIQLTGGGTGATAVLNVGGPLLTTAGGGALFDLQGNAGGAVLNVGGPAPGTLADNYFLGGEAGQGQAIINYEGGGGITQIGGASGGFLLLDGTGAALETKGIAGNSALASLTTVASHGIMQLQAGAAVATSGPLTNQGQIVLLSNGLPNALTVGGDLSNSGTLEIDNASTVATKGGLMNSGTILVGAPGFELFDTGSATLSIGGTAGNIGSITVSGSTMSVGSALVNTGSITLTTESYEPNGPPVFVVGATLMVRGSLTNGGQLQASGSSVTVGRSLVNSGDLEVPNLTVGGALENTGTADLGTASVAGEVENGGQLSLSGTASTGGLLNNAGGHLWIGAPVAIANGFTQTGSNSQSWIEGTVTAASLDVEGGTYTNDTGVTNVGAVSGTAASGSLNIASNGRLTDNATIDVGSSNTPGTVNNAGRVTLGRVGSMTLADGGSYTQTGGITDVNGTLIAANVAINDGVLSGTGTIQAATTIGANTQLSPGFLGIGRMNFSGSSSQPSLDVFGTWDERIIASSLFSSADISGELTLSNSVLDILLLRGYDPKVGTSFTIADFGSLSGTFGSILNDTFNNGKEDWLVAYNSTDIVLTAGRVHPGADPPGGDPPSDVPEPDSLELVFIGTGALGVTRRWRLFQS
jgi:hypothetical protein